MAFTKTGEGTIEKVFDNVEDVVDEMVKHIDTDDEMSIVDLSKEEEEKETKELV